MSKFTIFYAWQSDLQPKITRYFIEKSAKRAVKNIQQDIKIVESPRLDSDTQGRSGMPEITATIFDKIETCGIFLADLTYVGETFNDTGRKTKKLPNANVLLELGHASSKVGWDRIICVMNTFYGDPEEMIFDIKHRRFPITFNLENEKSQNKSEIKLSLVKELEAAMRSSMQSEHQAVLDSLKRLDRECYYLMSSYGQLEKFKLPSPNSRVEPTSIHLHVQSARHMLELGLMETEFDSVERTVSYTWTYLGKLVLIKIGQRIKL